MLGQYIWQVIRYFYRSRFITIIKFSMQQDRRSLTADTLWFVAVDLDGDRCKHRSHRLPGYAHGRTEMYGTRSKNHYKIQKWDAGRGEASESLPLQKGGFPLVFLTQYTIQDPHSNCIFKFPVLSLSDHNFFLYQFT